MSPCQGGRGGQVFAARKARSRLADASYDQYARPLSSACLLQPADQHVRLAKPQLQRGESATTITQRLGMSLPWLQVTSLSDLVPARPSDIC